MDEDFSVIRDIVNAAKLSGEVRHTVGWCLDRLPSSYRQLCATNESRHSDEVLHLVRAMLQALSTQPKQSPDAKKVAVALTAQLRAMHERLGIPLTLPRAG